MLRSIGARPLIDGFKTRLEKFASLTITKVPFIFGLFVAISMLHCTCVGLRGIKNHDKIKVLGPLYYYTCCTVQNVCLNLRSTTLKECLERVEMDWKYINVTEHRAMMLDSISFAHRVTLISTTLHYFHDTSYCTVLPIWTNSFTTANSTTKASIYPGIEYFVELPYFVSYYEFIYSAQWFYGLQFVTNEGRLYGIVASFACHVTETFRVQMQLLGELIAEEERRYGKREKILAIIVTSHVDTIHMKKRRMEMQNELKMFGYSKNCSEALQEFCFMEVIGSTFVTWALEYLCIMIAKSTVVYMQFC